jgi:hypothetical protein
MASLERSLDMTANFEHPQLRLIGHLLELVSFGAVTERSLARVIGSS